MLGYWSNRRPRGQHNPKVDPAGAACILRPQPQVPSHSSQETIPLHTARHKTLHRSTKHTTGAALFMLLVVLADVYGRTECNLKRCT
jgi:hypothetical protein